MNLEFDALLCNGIWTLVPPTSDMNIVGCKWVFCLKRKADGLIDRQLSSLLPFASSLTCHLRRLAHPLD